MSLFSIEDIQQRECLSLLYAEDADSFLVHSRECLSSLYWGGGLLPITQERVSLFYMQTRQTPPLYIRESVSFLCVEGAEPLSVQRTECLSSRSRGGRLRLDTEKTECLSSKCRGGRFLPCTEERVSHFSM